MTKRYDEPIEVTLELAGPERGAPVAFAWRGRRYDIDQRLKTWREGAEWWDPTIATERQYYRVLARPSGALASGDLDADGCLRSIGAVYDVYRDRIKGGWRLVRVWD